MPAHYGFFFLSTYNAGDRAMMWLRKLVVLLLVAAPLAGCTGGSNEIIRPTDSIKPPGTDAGGAMGAGGMLKPTTPQK
jgi:hypothetical protein